MKKIIFSIIIFSYLQVANAYVNVYTNSGMYKITGTYEVADTPILSTPYLLGLEKSYFLDSLLTIPLDNVGGNRYLAFTGSTSKPSGWGNYTSIEGYNWIFSPTNIIEIGNVKGKVKITNSTETIYFCIYDIKNGIQEAVPNNNDRYFSDEFSNDENFICPDTSRGFQLLNMEGFNSGSIPITGPNTFSKNGLTCQIKLFPDIDNTSWHNFGNFPIREDLSNTGSIRLKFSANTGSVTDYDILTYSKGNDFDINPSIIPFGSVPYPGSLTEEAFLRSDGYLNLVSYSGGVQRGFNLIQLNAIGITEGTASVSTYVIKQNGTSFIGSPKSWSGTNLMIGYQEQVKQIGLKYLTAFNGIRLGNASYINKTSCSTNFNICNWTIEEGSSYCGPKFAVNGLPLGSCSIAGSGSVYGSGSCVPAVDGSGSIIPPNPMAGGYVILDGSGNHVGSVLPPLQEESQEVIDGIFSCGIDENDSWYITIGKSLICPVTVVGNLFKNAYENVSKTINGINKINSVTSTLTLTGGAETSTGSNSGNIIGDTLALKMKDIGKTGKGVEFVGRVYQMGWWAMLLGFLIVGVMATIISIIKNKKNGI